MDEAMFRHYIALFNARDYERLITFYTEDVELELPASSPRGREGIRRYYSDLHRFVRERLRIDFLLVGRDRIATELYTEFRCLHDLPTFSFKPLVAGEVFRCTNFVHYDLVGDRFRRIRVARYKVHEADPRARPVAARA
ncbi:MAG TPA: nuclear transport factor 2 family protein [Candidatus Dormibacteraeota bacterium]|nr:nuclear transport factor 2 family protein [Candidatus Dormibacteraeota bacterium]